jgi:gamma-glutamyltranspeptidase/glutathione hydrolase
MQCRDMHRTPWRTPWLARLLALGLAIGLIGGLAPACDRQSPEPAATTTTPAEPAATPIETTETGPDDGSDRRLPAKAGEGTEVGVHGAVASAEAHATQIGLDVLQKGGNAVDAAVAVGFALGVTHPSAGNIGGGGFMVIRLADGTATTIDYREMAPLKAHRDMYLDKKGEVTRNSREGPLAAGIPGVVAGLAMAHEKYGSLPWKDLVMPAVKLAREGWTLDSWHADDMTWGTQRMKALADAAKKDEPKSALSAAYAATLGTFLKSDGSPYQTGELWKQPDLADTLEAIANDGPGAFYRGPVAKEMADKVQAMGGIWTEKDLAEYRAVERQPLTFEYRGHGIITMPPPSAGGVVLRHVLAASEVLELYKLSWTSIERIHLYIEALRRIYADRNFLIGDPAFVEIPMNKLLDVSYMTQRMADVDRNKATPSSKVGTGIQYKESSQTTHYSVIDTKRVAVSNTYTLNGGFGAKLQIPGTGVTLNNEMDDFTAKVGAPNMFGLVQGPQNSIAPKKRMLSSMSPTIVTKGGKLRAVVGSPGGPTITTTVAQIIMQIIDHGATLTEAVAAARIHHQWLPDRILHEPLDKDTVEALTRLGHEHMERGSIGHANCIEVDPDTGGLRAVADVTRDGGKAAAY